MKSPLWNFLEINKYQYTDIYYLMIIIIIIYVLKITVFLFILFVQLIPIIFFSFVVSC